MMTVKLMQKDYMYLANCLIPIGDQIGMTQQEIADMLRTKTKAFSEEEIRAKFPQNKTFVKAKGPKSWTDALTGYLPAGLAGARVKEATE